VKRYAYIAVMTLICVAAAMLFAGIVGGLQGWRDDPTIDILNGYQVTRNDSSSSSRAIVFSDGRSKDLPDLTIGPRVDRYKVVGSKILVAQRPITQVRIVGGEPVITFGPCEYWVIDTESRQVTRRANSDDWDDLDCY